jgi:transcriptional regulator with XRE-family HTH domain
MAVLQWVIQLKKYLTYKKISIRELSRFLEVSEASIYNWFNSGSIETKHLEKFAKHYNISLGYFFSNENPEKAKKNNPLMDVVDNIERNINSHTEVHSLLLKTIEDKEKLIKMYEAENERLNTENQELKVKIKK